MGSVYIVEHVELGRRYVLKSLLQTLATRRDLIARMRNEWRSLGKLRHPHIVDVLNAGATPDGVPYYVMELLSGETVRDRLARHGKFPFDQAVRIAQATLLGLAAAHAIGVVHRDIKPANIFLCRDGGVKVLDFGIAQVRMKGSPKITAQGLAIGTPRYMSPEQASGEKADARSDVYAVGLLLYEMMAGEGPFDDLTDITQQMLAHLHRPPRPLHHWADVPAGLVDIVERALSKNPDHRPKSAEYMAAELAPFAGPLEPRDDAPRSSSTSPPISAALSSLTPAGLVLSTSPPLDVKLSPTWQEPTMELVSDAAETVPRHSSVPAAAAEVALVPPRKAKVRVLGLAIATTVVAAIVIAAIGFGSPDKPSLATPIAAALSPSPATAAPIPTATATATTTATTTTTTTTTATAITVTADAATNETATLLDTKSSSRKRKRTPAPSAAPVREDAPVRLPPSGL
jgi:serine/threonine protein kinase